MLGWQEENIQAVRDNPDIPSDMVPNERFGDAIDEYASRRSEDTRIARLRSGWKLFSDEDLQDVETAREELENRVAEEDG
jgi:hypothetical protein